MAVTVLPDAAVLQAEITRRYRQRMRGAWVALAVVALLLVGVWFSFDMVHEGDLVPVTATIVAVEHGADETWMTSEFVDGDGIVRRDRQTAGYHYAPGEPEVGERIGYVYGFGEYTGDFRAMPRGDRMLQWIFGMPALLCLLLAGGVAWLARRQRRWRRILLVSGRREPGTAHAIVERNMTLPGAGGRVQHVRMWRLATRYLEPGAGFRDCHSDWQPAPVPVLAADMPVPPIFVDRRNAKRYWLPVGGLGLPAS